MSIMLLRLAVVSCGVAALVTGVLTIEYRQRAMKLEEELVVMGARVSELRLQSRHAAALLLQYEQRCEL